MNETVEQRDGVWCVCDRLHGHTIASGFATNAAAWRWIDKANCEPTGRKEASHDWATSQWLKT